MAEGTRLLSEYRGLNSIADSNPALSVFAGLRPLFEPGSSTWSYFSEVSSGSSFGTVGLVVNDAMIVDAGQRLAAAARSPARVVLFGSRARGDAREDSDLDFLVIEEHLDSKLSEMVRLRDALPPLAVPVDVVVVSEEEVARRSPVPSTLEHRALREGRIIVPA